MRCDDFIDQYSEYRDGLLSDELKAACEAHLAGCEPCRRYDRVLDRGVGVCRSLPRPSPSPDFMPRLQHRLFHIDDASRLTSRRALGGAALIAVASVGFLAVTWLPFATRTPVEIELPAVAVDAPVHEAARRRTVFEPGPYMPPTNSFFVPLRPTLDESSNLFTPFTTEVGGEVGPRYRRWTGQLDDAR